MPNPRLAFITIVASLAYLGLAILGWGGFAAFFSHPPLIALTIVICVLTRAIARTEAYPRGDQSYPQEKKAR
jgi:hypothetical protein